MKILKLVNSSPDRQGDPLLINADHIICVYEDHENGGSLSTRILGSGGIVWWVEESLFEVKKLLEN